MGASESAGPGVDAGFAPLRERARERILRNMMSTYAKSVADRGGRRLERGVSGGYTVSCECCVVW